MGIRAMLLLTCVLFGCGQSPKAVSFHEGIQPILNSHCVRCHGTEVARGNIVLTSYDLLMASRTVSGREPLVVPEKPAESWLYTLSATSQPHFRMPPDTAHLTPLPQEELELLARWIKQGAKNN